MTETAFRMDFAAWQDAAARAQDHPGTLAIDHLLEASGLEPADFTQGLAALSGLQTVDSEWLGTQASDDALVPLVDALSRGVMAVTSAEGGTLIALSDPWCERTRLWLEHRVRLLARTSVQWRLVERPGLQVVLQRRERSTRLAESLGTESTVRARAEDGLLLSASELQADADPVVRLVNATLYDALNAEASDIHLETDADGLTIRYRLDGVLIRIGRIDGAASARQAVSRLKVLADLDISEQRIPQDGRLKVRPPGREIDLRVSVMPSLHGEDVVLRVLDRGTLSADRQRLTLDALSLEPQQAAFIRRVARRPHGLFLVTGPTGSGKTTTLYGLLTELNDGLDKIATIEDPVEYELPGILQVPVNEAKGMTFARGLRSLLRHDPDKIMVGEIRDAETAQIAIQAALTGHQVFATVHANNVVDVVGRLSAMGVDPYNLAAALNAVIAQRLVRRICARCSTEHVPDPQVLEQHGLSADWAQGKTLRVGRGCPACRASGYKGRQAAMECLEFDDVMRSLVGDRASIAQVRAAARERGAEPLGLAALRLVAQGQTTFEELDRVATLDD
ncbi:MAG: type secretion system protein [Pseudomonadota bacterium]